MFYIYDDNPNKLNLISSNQKITDEQKHFLTEYLTAANKCRRPALNNLATFPKVISVIKVFNNERDVIFANLLAKRISIGQANQALMPIQNGFDMKLDTAMNATTKVINEQIQNEEAQIAKEESKKQLFVEKEKADKLAQEAKEAQKNLALFQKAEQATKEKRSQQSASSKQSAQVLQVPQEQERQYQIQLEQNRIQQQILAQQAEQSRIQALQAEQARQYQEAQIRQQQYQNIQGAINRIFTPVYTQPTPLYNGNSQPYLNAPQQQTINPSVNCVPNGVGGFRCQ
jgi:hypothetical protein